MLLHNCQTGLKNQKLFHTVLSQVSIKIRNADLLRAGHIRAMVAILLDPPKTKTSDSLNVFRSEIQEGFICICKEKKSFIQEESGRQGGPRMDDAEN